MREYIKINTKDNVAVALCCLSKGFLIENDGSDISVSEDIPQGHKVALSEIRCGEAVIKYGFPIGTAVTDISAGSWVHTHNLKTSLGGELEYRYEPTSAAGGRAGSQEGCFMGYRRDDGRVGIRNELWIIPTVGCVNSVVKAIEREAQGMRGGGVEEIVAFTHPYGCSQMGEDQENSRRILADLICHPNAGGVLVVGLGCENSGAEELKKYTGACGDRVRFMVAQEYEDEIAEALKNIGELAILMQEDTRKPVPLSELVVGLKCGGSDGLSGITANPLVGDFSDRLAACGGTTILTEVPEMFGAETILMNRCRDEGTFNETVKLINEFKDYYVRHNQVIYENPSPGNKKGGISTLEDKSLGCTQKSGSIPVNGVLPYGGRIMKKGLNLLSAPGNDLVASTALAASGAQLVLFTTGRGTPFASPVPTVKISSNTELAGRKSRWIDFDAGVLTERPDMETLGQEFFNYVVEVASGRRVKAEEAGFHDMAIFKQGVTL